jgi:SAM-dependent methyltransferase
VSRTGGYYRPDLSLVHDRGFGFHADMCAPGILGLLGPVRQRDGLVVELGCGSGRLTTYLLEAGHRVIATDASEAMLDLAREHVGGGADLRRLVLPDDPIPAADAIVSVGHVLNYLADASAVDRALVAASRALRDGGLLAIDLCDYEWAEARRELPAAGRVGDDWAIVTEFSVPTPDRFVRQIAAFVRNDDGSWRRDDERHENVMVDTARVPDLLREHGVSATVGRSFGNETLPVGLYVVTGRRSVRAR